MVIIVIIIIIMIIMIIMIIINLICPSFKLIKKVSVAKLCCVQDQGGACHCVVEPESIRGMMTMKVGMIVRLK